MQYTYPVNTNVVLTIQNPAGSGQGTAPADLTLLKNGVIVTTPTITVTDLASHGLYNFAFTPTTTGMYVLFVYGAIQSTVEVVSQTDQSYLQNLQDEALGSWVWDKVAGTLVMLRQDGTNLASFTVIDNLTTASRERTA